MSNVKVEKRKQEKYNRKKIEAAKKRKGMLLGAVALVLVVAIAGVLGVRIYDDYFRYDATADINPTSVSNAVSAVQQAGYEEPKEEEDKKEDADKKEESADADKKDEVADDKKDESADADKKDEVADDKKDESADADKEDESADAEKTEDDKADESKAE